MQYPRLALSFAVFRKPTNRLLSDLAIKVLIVTCAGTGTIEVKVPLSDMDLFFARPSQKHGHPTLLIENVHRNDFIGKAVVIFSRPVVQFSD